MSNALLRIITAVIGAPLLLGMAYLGGWYFGVLVLVMGVLAQVEIYGLMEQGGLRPWKEAGVLIGGLLALRAFVPELVPVALVVALGVLAWSPFSNRGKPLDTVGATFLGALYPTALLAFLTDLRLGRGDLVDNMDAFYLTLAVFLLVWATDILAYYTGKSIGKTPLAPSISPKKTWEGSIGGAIGAVLVAVLLKMTVLNFLDWPHLIVMALICGIVSQVGDLVESSIKRSVGAKDSGTLLPGHGGMLDRFDAMLLAVPLVFLYLRYVAGLFA
jgi:phosphatidate cytidylyltransferase